MAREILFKAKRIDNGEWVEGSLVTRKYHNTDEVFEAHIVFDAYEQMGVLNFGSTPVLISPLVEEKYDDGCFRVDYNTICQYTGLTDKNGNKIWENDVVKVETYMLGSPFGERMIGKIVYEECAFFVEPKDINKTTYLYADECAEVEVIGNIFDNPELLGGGE